MRACAHAVSCSSFFLFLGAIFAFFTNFLILCLVLGLIFLCFFIVAKSMDSMDQLFYPTASL